MARHIFIIKSLFHLYGEMLWGEIILASPSRKIISSKTEVAEAYTLVTSNHKCKGKVSGRGRVHIRILHAYHTLKAGSKGLKGIVRNVPIIRKQDRK